MKRRFWLTRSGRDYCLWFEPPDKNGFQPPICFCQDVFEDTAGIEVQPGKTVEVEITMKVEPKRKALTRRKRK